MLTNNLDLPCLSDCCKLLLLKLPSTLDYNQSFPVTYRQKNQIRIRPVKNIVKQKERLSIVHKRKFYQVLLYCNNICVCFSTSH